MLIIFISLFFYFGQRGMRDVDMSDNREINIINKSNADVFFVLSDSGELKKPHYKGSINLLMHDSSGIIDCSDVTWKSLAENSMEKKICIYILDKDSVIKYGIDSIFIKQIYTKKILVDIDYLEKNKWTVVYK